LGINKAMSDDKSRRYIRTRPPLFVTGDTGDFRRLYHYLVALDEQRDAIDATRENGDFQGRLTAEIRFDASAKAMRDLLIGMNAWPDFRVDLVIDDLRHGEVKELRYKDTLGYMRQMPPETKSWISRNLSIIAK
jgi:hypothetical protein